MLIQIPFPYAAEVKIGRARNSERKTLLGRIDVIFREVEAESAPVAFWWAAPDLNSNVQVAVRSNDGALYHPIFLQEGRDALVCEHVAAPVDYMRKNRRQRHPGLRDVLAEPRLITAKAFAEVLSRGVTGGTMAGPGSTRVADAAPEDVHSPEELNVRHILQSEMEGQAAKIAKFADEILLIDGVPHRKIDQPGIRVGGRYPSLDMVYQPDWHGYAESQIFQIDQFSEAMDDAQSRGASRSGQIAAPDITRPDLLDLGDPLGAAARSIAGHIVHRLSQDAARRHHGPDIANYDLAVIKAWMDVRDADRSDTLGLIQALQTFRAAAGETGMLRDKSDLIDQLSKRQSRLLPADPAATVPAP